MASAVDKRSAEVERMAAEWPMLDALMGGTGAMRAAGESLLPRFPQEDVFGHAARLRTAVLFPAYRRTVAVMSGKPFSKPLTLSDDTPAQIVEWAKDIDREGVNLHSFAAEMFRESFFGLAGILVEAPKPLETGARPPTLADAKAAGFRPYFVRVMHNQLLGWRFETVQGVRKLTQLRLAECETIADGDFGEKEVERVRVLEPGSWKLYEKQDVEGSPEARWVLIDEGATSLDYIPFVPLYGWRTGFMRGVSPLLDLAYMNVRHWQSQSDQDNILHVARVPILFAKGFAEAEQITVGASSAVKATSADADLKFVEHTGAAIDAGTKSIEQLEQQMIQAGAELLVKKPGDRSATESANDAEANKSDLQRIVEGFEGSLDHALKIMADYAKLPAGGHATLYKDFGAATLGEATAQVILSLQQGGLLSKATAITELKRRGVLSDEVDPVAEAEAVAEEGPGLGELGGDLNGEGGPGDQGGGAGAEEPLAA